VGGAVEKESTKVSVTLGYTLNLGNFQSLRVDIGVVDSVRNEEDIDQATNRVYDFVESKVIEKVNEAKAELVTE
jgi:hypothetical protein